MMCRVFQQLSALPIAVCANSGRLQSRNFYKLNDVMLPPLHLPHSLRRRQHRQAGGNPPKKATLSQHANITRPFALCHIKQTMLDLANKFEQLLIAVLLYPALIYLCIGYTQSKKFI